MITPTPDETAQTRLHIPADAAADPVDATTWQVITAVVQTHENAAWIVRHAAEGPDAVIRAVAGLTAWTCVRVACADHTVVDPFSVGSWAEQLAPGVVNAAARSAVVAVDDDLTVRVHNALGPVLVEAVQLQHRLLDQLRPLPAVALPQLVDQLTRAREVDQQTIDELGDELKHVVDQRDDLRQDLTQLTGVREALDESARHCEVLQERLADATAVDQPNEFHRRIDALRAEGVKANATAVAVGVPVTGAVVAAVVTGTVPALPGLAQAAAAVAVVAGIAATTAFAMVIVPRLDGNGGLGMTAERPAKTLDGLVQQLSTEHATLAAIAARKHRWVRRAWATMAAGAAMVTAAGAAAYLGL